MSRYLLIETKGPLDGGDYAFEIGKQLSDERHDVTIYLLQDAVFAARPRFEAGARLLEEAKARGLTVLADAVSLRQRGIGDGRLAPGVRASGMEGLVDLLMEHSDKAIWH